VGVCLKRINLKNITLWICYRNVFVILNVFTKEYVVCTVWLDVTKVFVSYEIAELYGKAFLVEVELI
jgi:hypothetical protein